MKPEDLLRMRKLFSAVLNDRRGFHVDDLDEETKNDLLDDLTITAFEGLGVCNLIELLREARPHVLQEAESMRREAKKTMDSTDRTAAEHDEYVARKLLAKIDAIPGVRDFANL